MSAPDAPSGGAAGEGSEDPLAPSPDAPDIEVHGDADPEADGGGAGEAHGGGHLHADVDAATASVEQLIDDLERTSAQRDEYLEALRRNQADFENYRKRVMKQQADEVARAAERLVETLLPVLDACDGAIRHGASEVEPVFAALLGTLEKEGLERIDPAGEAFDPNRHEAVMHEPGDDGDTVVSDVMRPGYAWKGRIVRPAMVKVRG